MTRCVMPLTSQAVAISLLTSHIQIAWNPGQVGIKEVPGSRYYHLMENPKNHVEQ